MRTFNKYQKFIYWYYAIFILVVIIGFFLGTGRYESTYIRTDTLSWFFIPLWEENSFYGGIEVKTAVHIGGIIAVAVIFTVLIAFPNILPYISSIKKYKSNKIREKDEVFVEKTKSNKAEISKNILKLIRSLVFIFVSFYGFNASGNIFFSGEQVRNSSYGGDAYTGIQNAAAAAARNIDKLGDVVENAAHSFFIMASIILIAFGIIGVIEAVINIKHLKNSKYELNKYESESND